MPDYTRNAGNAFNQLVEPIDYSDKYAPSSKTYHGITLVVNGYVLGRVQRWDNSGAYNREGEHVFELTYRTPGLNAGIAVTCATFALLVVRVLVPALLRGRRNRSDRRSPHAAADTATE